MNVCNKCGRKLVSRMGGKVVCLCEDEVFVVENVEPTPEVQIVQDEIQRKKEIQGREVWKNLHSYVFKSPKDAQFFYEFWQLTIPSFGCSCKSHWAELVKEFPPDFSSAESFFKWGVDAHNKVNERLGKSQFSYKDAVTLYEQDLCID
jgi:hypothetical protein